MRSATKALVSAALLLCLQGCDYIYNPHLYDDDMHMRAVNKQLHARDLCLSTHVAQLDDGMSDPAGVGLAAANACTEDTNKLINLLVQQDTDSRAAITTAIQKDTLMKATSLVLVQRAVPPKTPKPPAEEPSGMPAQY